MYPQSHLVKFEKMTQLFSSWESMWFFCLLMHFSDPVNFQREVFI